MQTYPVAGPSMLDPMWFNTVRYGEHAAEVAVDGSLTVAAVALRLCNATLAAGTAVKVWLNGSGSFVCDACDEMEREAQAWRDALPAKAEDSRRQRNSLRAEAEAFNARLVLPVRWDVGIKDVLSGRSETSWGDGRNKATVGHVYLLEDLQVGRFKRQAGDFLSTTASGTNGKRWSSTVARGLDGDGTPFQPQSRAKPAWHAPSVGCRLNSRKLEP